MAMRVGDKGGIVAEINVTPMADVMIVLLVIFMVVTPLLPHNQGLTLPPAAHAGEKPARATTVVVILRDDSTTWLDGHRVDTAPELLLEVRARLGALPETGRVVHVKAGKDLDYARVLDVMDLCRDAGAEQVALMTDKRVGG